MNILDEAQVKDRLGKGRSVVVDFHADWCAPCRAISPILEDLAATHDETDFVKVDADANPEFVAGLGIQGLPTVVRFGPDGTEAARSVGAVPAAVLAKRLGLDG